MSQEQILIVFVALTGAAVLMQACVLLALFLTVRRTAKMAQDEMAEFRTVLIPAVTESREFLKRVGPRVETVVVDLADLATNLKAQGEEMQASTTEMMERLRRQTSRLDIMLSDVLDRVDRAGNIVSDAVNVPLRQVAGMTAFAKAALAALRQKNPPLDEPKPTHAAADRDLFV